MPDVSLPEAGDEAAFGLEGPVLAAEVGAEDVDVACALVAGDRLGVLCLARGATRFGAQPLYLPALFVRGAATVADGSDAILDLTLIQARPEPEVPTMLPSNSLSPIINSPDASFGCRLSSIWKSSSSPAIRYLLFQDMPTYYAPTSR
jgi:hypothetical protein